MFNRATENHPALQTSTAVAIAPEPGSAIVTAGRVPKTVQRGVLDVMLAFPTLGRPDADTRIVLDLYLEAVEGYPRAVVEWTLKFLVFNNPRNTPNFSCPPTPQDVREACKVTHACWERAMITFYFEEAWAKPSTNQMLKRDNDAILQRYYAAHRGGKPGQTDCIIPEDLQIVYLRREIERQLPCIETEDRRRRNEAVPLLLLVEDEQLDRIPASAFPDGALDMVRDKRAARAQAAVKAAEHEAYLKSLPPKVRAMRWIVVNSDAWKNQDEAEIRAEVDQRLQQVHAARLEAEKDGLEFLGMTFADGSEWRERNI